ncbi:MAG TPA: type III pantothenate kinase [Cyclobacteriaceae bacterium]|nr:type III pantothenate kinase [Cyclobacteriaceae bacterium]
MNLIIDYGNTAAKVGIFDQHELKQRHSFNDSLSLENFLKNNLAENVIISSVNVDPHQIIANVLTDGLKIILNPDVPIPINNHYQTPSTLGMDRLAAICGAIKLFPHENTLVINAGTCITYDFVDDQKNYWGGAISPGLNMRFKAVHTFTSRLPLVEPVDNIALIGNSTETSIQSGVANGMTAEINGIIEQYRGKYHDLKVILAGGDGPFFENKLKASIFASPNIVLIGLNSILIYNVNR